MQSNVAVIFNWPALSSSGNSGKQGLGCFTMDVFFLNTAFKVIYLNSYRVIYRIHKTILDV